MNGRDDRRFRALLRWYPATWRREHGEVLLGTLLEEAERQGRTTPSAGERMSAIAYGLGARLNNRLALVTALAALMVAAVAGIITLWVGWPTLPTDARWLMPILTGTVGPILLTLSAVALARYHGLVSELRALVIVVFVSCAHPLATLAQISWAVGFDAANRDVALTGFATSWPWFFVVAWTFGAVGAALFVEALLRKASAPRWVSAGLALLCGIVLTPVVGLTLVAPYSTAIGAAGLTLLALVPTRSVRATAQTPAETVVVAPVAVPGASTARSRILARLFAWTSTVAGSIGIAFALTGSTWTATGPDATATMAQGITIALASALPLIAAVGLVVVARRRARALHTWGPLLLLALSLGAMALAYTGAPDWNRMLPGFAAASVLGGTAIAWWVAARLRSRGGVRLAVSGIIGLGYAAIGGILVLPLLAFALPVLAALFSIWGVQPPRPLASATSHPK